MNLRHVLLDGTCLCNWNGGIDFLANMAAICREVQSNSSKLELKVSVMLPYRIPKYENLLRRILGKASTERNKHIDFVTETIRRANFDAEIVYLRKYDMIKGSENWALNRLVRKNKVDCVIGVTNKIYDKLPIPWVSYIPDYQHKYLPQFFDQQEIASRDAGFSAIAEASPYFIATSYSHKSDLINFSHIQPERVFTMPFAPIGSDLFLNTEDIDIQHYHLPKDYFLISNQFWQHKSHKTAIRALKLLHDDGYPNMMIVCTGHVEDYRNNEYIISVRQLISDLGLENHFKLLGFIPKMEQIEVMKNARALIQPSLFEGDPGGCSTYDAVGLDLPVILSDIPVNLEAKEYDNAYFFKAEDVEDLARQMRNILQKDRNVYSQQKALQKREKNKSIQKEFFENMIIKVCEGEK